MPDNSCAFPMQNDMLHKPAELRGLTKREWVASQILAGMCSSGAYHADGSRAIIFATIEMAVDLADILLKRLSTPE